MESELTRLSNLEPLKQNNKINIKKNSSFIKKLKLPQTDFGALSTELSTLNLSKYVEEVQSTLVAVLAKLTLKSHFVTFTSLVVQLSCYYEEFQLIPQTDFKNGLRAYSYLCLVGRGEWKVAVGALETFSKKGVSGLETILMFCKDFINHKRLPEKTKALIMPLLKTYFKDVTAIVEKGRKRLVKMKETNNEYFISRGVVYEDRVEKYNKAKEELTIVLGDLSAIAELIDEDRPDIHIDDEAVINHNASMVNLATAFASSANEDKDWDSGGDQDSKQFYEDLIYLRDFVPASLFPGTKESTENETERPLESDLKLSESDSTEILEIPFDELDTTELNKVEDTPSWAGLESLLSRIPLALNRAAIDQVAVDFTLLNTKNARKKLEKTLLAVPRGRSDMLPYYARLIATLSREFPDIGSSIVESLEKEFRRHVKRRDTPYIDEKVKNVRFLGELVKFRVTPTHVTFFCLKVLLEDFTHHNIEVLCNLLESCGRFLFKTPENNPRMTSMLEIMMRKKQVQNLDSRQSLMVENAFYQCNPPDVTAAHKKERTPLQLYLRNLFYKELGGKMSVDVVLLQVRKLNWHDSSHVKALFSLYTKIHKIRFSNLHHAAYIVAQLSRSYPDFAVAVTDSTLESIRTGLETNLFKHNQRRISCAKFFAELYNYRIVDRKVLMDTLLLIIRFGHEKGIPTPNSSSFLDSPRDYFRIRLICTIIDACRHSIPVRNRQFKLVCGLLQVYYFSKQFPVPKDIEYCMEEVVDTLPGWKWACSYQDAVETFLIIASMGVASDAGEEEQVDSMPDQQVIDEEAEFIELAEEVQDDPEDDDEYYSDSSSNNDEQDNEAERLFELEFSRVMHESIKSRRNERKSAPFDMPVPKLKDSGAIIEKDGKVAFSVLTRRQQVRSKLTKTGVVELPADSEFAISTMMHREAEAKEKEHLKQLVLSYNEDRIEEDVSDIALISQKSVGTNKWSSKSKGSSIRGRSNWKLSEFF